MPQINPIAANLIRQFLQENWDDFLLLADHNGITEREAHDHVAELERPHAPE